MITEYPTTNTQKAVMYGTQLAKQLSFKGLTEVERLIIELAEVSFQHGKQVGYSEGVNSVRNS